MMKASELDCPVCDCHIHSFSKSAGTSRGSYEPPKKDVDDYVALTQQLPIKRAVIVHASVDGTDNSRLVQVLSQPHGIQLRGVATIDTQSADLEQLHRAGVRGLRLQDRAKLGASQLDQFELFYAAAAQHDWHIELNTEPASFNRLQSLIKQIPRQQILLLDHMAHVDPQSKENIDDLCRLMDSGHVWVKLSPTRVTGLGKLDDYSDLVSLIQRLVSDYPEQCVWGSDWPHVMTQEPLPSIASMLTFFRQTLSQDHYAACMWRNPEQLYWR